MTATANVLRWSLFALFLFTFTRGGGMHDMYIGHFTVELFIATILYTISIALSKRIKARNNRISQNHSM